MGNTAPPPAVADCLRKIAREFDALGRQWALVGGLAVRAYADSGVVDDIDIAVAVENDADAERLVNVLQQRGYSAITGVEDVANNRLASVTLQPVDKGEAPSVQLLFAAAGIEHELVRDAIPRQPLPGLRCLTATPGHLIALKLLSHADGRPHDLLDIRALLRRASEKDLETARDALVLITERGFSRKRDLHREFDAVLAAERHPAQAANAAKARAMLTRTIGETGDARRTKSDHR